MSAQDNLRRTAIDASTAPLRAKASNYPEPFFSRMGKRQKRPLGDLFALKNFGVNLTRLLPGGESALLHRHNKQDELVYILEGNPTLVTDAGEELLRPDCARDSRRQAARTNWSTAPTATSSISRSAIAPPVTRWPIHPTISRPRSVPTAHGVSPARTEPRTDHRSR